MGKKSKTRSGSANTIQRVYKAPALNLALNEEMNLNLHAPCLSLLKNEVSDSLKEMFELYFAEFLNALAQGKPISNLQYFSFNQGFYNNHNSSCKLGDFEEIESLYEVYYVNANSFSDKLLQHLSSYDESELIIVMNGVVKAYTVFMRASGEVKHAMQKYYNKNLATFEELNKVIFFHRVLRPLQVKIQSAETFINQCEGVKEACDLLNEMSMFVSMLTQAKCPNRVKVKKNKTNAKLDLNAMSVDDIVNFVNGENNSKKSSQNTNSEIIVKQENDPEIDEEIEKFQQSVESMVVSPSRFKPRITQE